MLLLLSLLEAAATTPTESAEAETWESKGKKWDLVFHTNLQFEKRFSRIVADTAKTFEQKSRDIHAFIQQYGNRR